MILEEVKEAFVKDVVAAGKRVDGRGLLDYRDVRVEKNVLPNAEGSALAHFGDTKVLAGVKFDLMEPFPDKPNEGVITFNSEFSPIAHPEFEPGPPREESIELARVVDRGIRSAGVIDLKKFLQEDGKVLGLFVDLYTIDHSGNLIDAAALAAMAALSCTRVPVYKDGKISREEFTGPLELKRKVVTASFEKISGKTVADARYEEEIASDGRLTTACTDDGFVAAMQKSGAAGFSKQEVNDLIALSFEKTKPLLSKV